MYELFSHKTSNPDVWVDSKQALQPFFFQLGFTPCKAEQSLKGMELQEKGAQKD